MYKLGLIAEHIENSVSPLVFTTLCRAVGEAADYEVLNVKKEELARTVEYARAHFNGFNVTMPYKQTILEYVDELDESAAKCGSSNTVLVRDGRLIAYNTDGWGLVRALKDKGFAFAGRNVVLLGAGGVACSIAYHLDVNRVSKVDVVNLYEDEAVRMCERFGTRFKPYPLEYEVLEQCCRGADLFINASVMGQTGFGEFESFAFLDCLKPEAYVFDVNYTNPGARLVPAAREKGHKAYIGNIMTASQGMKVIEIWTGKTPSAEAVGQLIKLM